MRFTADKCSVHGQSILNGISRRAPAIVLLTLFAALAADWLDAPVALPRGLAILVGSLALVLLAASGRRRLGGNQDPVSDNSKSWIAYELEGQGMPPGFYALGFFVIVTIVLTGMQSPYSLPAWAALCLGIAWGRANASYPIDDE